MAKSKSHHEEILGIQIKAEKDRFAPDMDDGAFFEIFAAQQVLKNSDLSDVEIKSGIVGEGNDGGIDGLYFFINGALIQEEVKDYDHWKKHIVFEIFLIQAKRETKFGETAILKLVNTTEDLFNIGTDLNAKKIKQRYNPELLETAERFQKAYRSLVTKSIEIRFHYVYASQGTEVHPNTQDLTEKLEAKVKDLFPQATFQFEFLGAKELAQIAMARPIEKIGLSLSQQAMYSGQKSCVCLVKLKDFYKFITDQNTNKINRHIFEANVRDYQGDVVVNKEIRETLETNDDENFWWLNNGITILTAGITPNGSSSLILDTPEIVNGLQTSNELYGYFASVNLKTLEADDREVLVRVIQPEDDKSRDRIIKATNSQTKIPAAALKATDPVHRNIEQFLLTKGLFYDRRKNYYKNEGRPQSKIITITELAQAMIAIVLGHPDDARARPSSILADNSQYEKIFSDRIQLSLYYAVIQIMDKVAEYFSHTELNQNEQTNLRYYVAYYASCLSCAKDRLRAADILAVPDILSQGILDDALIRTKAIYKKSGGNDKAAKGSAFREAMDRELLAKFRPAVAKAKAAAKKKTSSKKASAAKKVAGSIRSTKKTRTVTPALAKNVRKFK